MEQEKKTINESTADKSPATLPDLVKRHLLLMNVLFRECKTMFQGKVLTFSCGSDPLIVCLFPQLFFFSDKLSWLFCCFPKRSHHYIKSQSSAFVGAEVKNSCTGSAWGTARSRTLTPTTIFLKCLLFSFSSHGLPLRDPPSSQDYLITSSWSQLSWPFTPPAAGSLRGISFCSLSCHAYEQGSIHWNFTYIKRAVGADWVHTSPSAFDIVPFTFPFPFLISLSHCFLFVSLFLPTFVPKVRGTYAEPVPSYLSEITGT